MSLVPCPACNRQLSTEAEACPGCGHPMRSRSQPAARPRGPACYSCSSEATTRCQACGTLSCAVHVDNIYVSHGRGGANELRCESCYSSAMTWKIVGIVFFVIGVIVVLSMWASHR